MPTPTYTPLGSVTLSAATSEVSFNNIPTSASGVALRDLVLVVDGTVGSAALIQLRFNGDASSSYSYIRAVGLTSTTVSDAGSATSTSLATVIGTSQSVATLNIFDYSTTDKHKTVLSRSMSGVVEVWMGSARWANTAAINQITVGLNVSSLNAGTTLTLYGIAG
jgi:hypothetical protein